MKLLLIIVFALTLVIPAFSQNGQLAKSEQEYTKMFHDQKIKLARRCSMATDRLKKS